MKIIVLFFCFSLLAWSSCVISNSKDAREETPKVASVLPKTIQHIEFSIWEVISDEMSMDVSRADTKEQRLKVVPWSKEEQLDFWKLLQDPKSYGEDRSMLEHYNLVFELQTDEGAPTMVRISTMTGRVEIMSPNAKVSRRKCGKKMSQYILKILSKYQLKSLFDEADFMGFDVK